MEKQIKTIGVLTSGGDAPGMNAAVRAVVRTGLHKGYRMIGIQRGYNGLLNGECFEMNLRSVSNIISAGGSLIGTILQSQSAFLHLCIGVVFCQRKSMPRPSCICGIFYKCNATHRILICCLNLIIFTHIPYIIRRSLLITPPAIILYCNQLWLLLVDSHGKGMHLANAFC